jgi:1-acyl-sn-glycerol-3-phosphate acyltransferase
MQRRTPNSDSLAKRALRSVLRLLFRISITGDTGSFRNERTLIVANHESLIDGLLLALFLPVRALLPASPSGLELWIAGTLSPRASSELSARGWDVHDHAAETSAK